MKVSTCIQCKRNKISFLNWLKNNLIEILSLALKCNSCTGKEFLPQINDLLPYFMTGSKLVNLCWQLEPTINSFRKINNIRYLPACFRWKTCHNISLCCAWQVHVFAFWLHLCLSHIKIIVLFFSSLFTWLDKWQKVTKRVGTKSGNSPLPWHI